MINKSLILILFFLTFGAYGQIQRNQINDQMIKKRIQLHIDKLRKTQSPDGSWNFSRRYKTGATALNVLALATAGIKDNDPMMKKALAFLTNNFPTLADTTYSVGLYACAFEAVDGDKYQKQIKMASDWLLARQAKNGTWNYQGTGPGDNSITQFGLLALKAAEDAGIKIPKKAYEKANKFFINSQRNDGGWGYTSRSSST